ncbi:MAG TPA: hypothetical protein VKE69_11460, partial [Planctomycetota bacterium]|nr:hypothetical protein [Planctomycetota bacterium]
MLVTRLAPCRGQALVTLLAPIAVAAILAIAAGAAALRFARPAAASLSLFRVEPARVAPLQLPLWVPKEWVAEAERAIAARSAFSIFDDRAVDDLRAEIARLPWVREVRALKRELPRTLRLALTPRAPIAIVQRKENDVLVDATTTVLPPGTFDSDAVG